MKMMYKGVLGWNETDEAHIGTHKLLTNDEYREMIEERYRMVERHSREMQEAKSKASQAELQSWESISKAKEDFEERQSELMERVYFAEKETEFQKNLNENLLRICKERANADRKLKPKKEHSGYVVMSSQEKEIKYQERKKWYAAVVWETVLQSPYSIEFTEDQARKLIFGELLTNEGGWKLGDIGITSRQMIDYGQLVLNDGEKLKEVNKAFNQRLRANYKAGYWEYIVLHTLPLGPVPKDMLP